MNKLNNIKALIFDLDGTLLSSRKSIAPRTLESLIYLKSQGMRIIIATGRPPLTSMQKLGQLNLKTPMVCANGACVYDPVTNTPIEEVFVNIPSIERILKIAQDTNKNAILYTINHTYLPQDLLEEYLLISDARESKSVLASILSIDNFKNRRGAGL